MLGLEKIDKLEKMILVLDNAVENLQSEVKILRREVIELKKKINNVIEEHKKQ